MTTSRGRSADDEDATAVAGAPGAAGGAGGAHAVPSRVITPRAVRTPDEEGVIVDTVG
jgi:hypothetical protein